MAINSVSFLNNSAVELVKANAVQFSNKNNNLNKVTTEKEANKNNEIKDSVNVSEEALEKFMAEKNQNTSKVDKNYGSDKSAQKTEYKNVNSMLSALKARKAYC